MEKKDKIVFINKHLFYELRMLLGAARVICFFNDKKIQGSHTSYLNDSIYVHTRNLYNFFSNESGQDAKVSEYTSYYFDTGLFKKWKSVLNTMVNHIKQDREKVTSYVGEEQISDVIDEFKKDIERLWSEWIANTTDTNIKKLLTEGLRKARRQAQDDYDNLVNEIIKKRSKTD